MNDLKLVLNYKYSSKIGTHLIPFDDSCSALSVDSIGSYYASEEYRYLNESINSMLSNDKVIQNNIISEQNIIVSHTILSPALSPIQQKKLLNSLNFNPAISEVNSSHYSELVNLIDERLLPTYETQLQNDKFLTKLISNKLLKCENSSKIIENITIDASVDYKRSLREVIVEYLLLNKKVAKKFGINSYRTNFINTIIRARVPWNQFFATAKKFNEEHNYICHPVIIELIKIWDKHFRSINILDFNSNKSLNSDQFKSLISQNCQKMNYRLKFEWVSMCSQTLLIMCPNLISLDSIKNENLFNSIATLMSRQMRQLVLNNIENWINILTNRTNNSMPLFEISIKCKPFGVPYFVPRINTWKELFIFPVYQILNANQNIPRIENQLILRKPKNFCSKLIESVYIQDIEVQKYLGKILDILDKVNSCHSIISHYEREFTLNLFETNLSEKDKFYEIKDLRKIIKKSEAVLKKLVFQSNYLEFGVFQIDCQHLNSYINSMIKNRVNKMIENKVSEILSLAQHICDTFLTIEQNINKQSNSTSALIDQIKQFEEYKSNINLMLIDIEYIENEWTFVVEEGSMFLNDTHFELFHKLYNWPKKIKTLCDENNKRFISRKSEVENSLKERVLTFENELKDLERIINDFKKKRLSSPIESIADNCKLLDDIQTKLNKAIQESKDINHEEELLEYKTISKFPLLKELVELNSKLDNIWKTADLFQERETEWMSKSMRALNLVEVRESVENLLNTSIKMSETLKSESIDLVQNANTLQMRIDSFKRKYIPLLEVLSNPVLRDRHWRKISDILGQEMSPDSCRTLTDIISLTNATQHIDEIQSLGSIAMKEHALEVFLERMKYEWIEEWPKDALEIAANKFLEGESLETELKEKCANAFKFIHEDSRLFLSFKMSNKSDLKVYVTPPLFLEFILTFKDLLKKKQKYVSSQRNRYLRGVEKLDLAANHVEIMRNKLINDFQPLLVIASEETEILMIKIEKETLEIETKREIIAADEAIANKSAALAQQIRDECTKELSQAIPAIKSAINALNTLKAEDIRFLRTMKNPPSGVKMVLEAVCIIKGVQPERKSDPKGLGKLIEDYWSASLRMLSSDIKFLESLKSFDRNHIPRDSIALVRERYLHSSDFDPTSLRKVSIACEGLAKWVKAIDIYDRVINVVKPKREKLKSAEQELIYVMEKLEKKKKELQQTSDKLQQLNDEFAAMSKKKKELEENIDFCSLKLERAEQLIKGLEIEKKRWKEAADLLSLRDENVVGDILLSAATIVYASALNSNDRYLCANKWQKYLKDEFNLLFTQPFNIINTLGTSNEVRIWTAAGLSSDQFSTENAIIAQNSRRFPFIINPNESFNNWIKRLYPNLVVIDFEKSNQDLKEILFKAIKTGEIVLVENVNDPQLNPTLKSLIENEIVVKEGIQVCVQVIIIAYL
jgi:hypothetical protein